MKKKERMKLKEFSNSAEWLEAPTEKKIGFLEKFFYENKTNKHDRKQIVSLLLRK